MSMLRVISGAPLFTDLPALKAHYTERVLFCIATYLTTLIAHYIGRGALLYRNLFNCFHSTLRWKGRSFVSQLI